MAFKKYRNMKVCEQSGRNYKPTPTITLKGQWLNDCGFDMDVPIIVKCEDGRLTITHANKTEVDYMNTMENQPTSKDAESAFN